MILVDVNLLVEATMSQAPRHGAARPWWHAQLVGSGRIALPWVSLTGFVRVVGQSRIWTHPMPVGPALGAVRSWLSRPNVWIPEAGPQHLDLLDSLLGADSSVRLVTDAHIAALAMEHGLTVCSRDGDFARWSDLGLRHRDPLR